MSITIPIGTWIIPATVTLLGCIVVAYFYQQERGDSGWMPYFITAIVGIASCAASIVAWITWALTAFIK